MQTVTEIAEDFVELCEEGAFAEAGEKYWAEDVVSIEAMGDAPRMQGKEALRAKSKWWYDNHEVHEVEVEGPYVNGDQFAVVFELDVTPKATGERMEMEEVALYTVKDGKIVEERYFYRQG